METLHMTSTTPPDSFDLKEILEGELLSAHFQPLVSVRKKFIVGYEGLIRGLNPATRQIIPPEELFHRAGKMGLMVELDRLCRKKVLERFQVISAERPETLLSLNFEASIIDQGVVGSGNLINQVTSLGLNPDRIALEIIESNIRDLSELQKFIQTYRDYGFLIALDDVGAGHSNLNRIPLLKPDILKVDRYLVQNISNDFYKQEVFKSLVALARKIGALVLAEGVETEEEAFFVMELGVDLIQGFYFSKPQPYDQIDDEAVNAGIQGLARQFKGMVLQKHNIKKFNLKKYELMTREVQTELGKSSVEEFDRKLSDLIHYFPLVECLYVIDENGFQASETIFGELENGRKNRFMFRPASKGTDHTMKDFYYMMMDGGLRKSTFISEPYLSLATGNACVTFARLFKDLDGKINILCVDINTQYLQQISVF